MITQASAERYGKAKKIFFAALKLGAQDYTEFIQTRCGDDWELRREVESLLDARRGIRDFLETPPYETVFVYKNLENKVIGGYRLIRKIGEGGMGVVFLAEKTDPDFRRQVALKIVKTEVCSKKIFKRFNLERRILAQLEHPNIAHLIDGGKTSDGLPYLVMEYVEGVPLIEFAESRKLSLKKRLELFRQVCAAVSFAHRHAVIHRDLKPSNILVTSDEQVKLLDFGIAKLLSADTLRRVETATTFRAMTPEFASPEQIKNEPATTASDTYSLGVVLYKLLTGHHPYKTNSENWNEIIRAACEIEPTRPSSLLQRQKQNDSNRQEDQNKKEQIITPQILRGDLDNIILKALRKTPERRYSSVEQFSDDLRRHLEGLPVSARPNTFFYRAQKFVRRNRLPVALTVLVILAMLGGIVAAGWQANRAERERARAERRFQDVRSLVNSFMFELNDEILKGQTQARELVVSRALEYLDKLSAESKDDFSLQRETAVAYLKIGDIQGKPYSPNLGNTNGALESYGKALSILEKLHNFNPKNREIKRDLALTLSGIGLLQNFRTMEREKSAQNLEKARVLLEDLAAAEPENLQTKRYLSDVYKSIADLPDEDSEEKILKHQKALKIREELLAIEPDNIKDLTATASIYQRIGTAYKNRAERLAKKNSTNVQEILNIYRNVLSNFIGSLSVYRNLMTIEPNNSRHRRNFADILAMSLPIKANLGDKSGVSEDYQSAIGIFEKLSADDPKNFEARFDIAFTEDYMCRSLVKLGSVKQALQNCRKAMENGMSLLAIDSTNAEARKFVYESFLFFAEVLYKEKFYAESLKVLHQLNAVFEKVSSEDEISYFYNISYKLGYFYMDLAAKVKASPAEKKKNYQTARHWLKQSLNAFNDYQKLEGKNDVDKMLKIKEKIARCDAAM